jgi:hypothetical protein
VDQEEALSVEPTLTSSAVGLIAKLDVVIDSQRALGKVVLERTTPKPGPYALFHHHGLLIQRLEDLRRIVHRIGEARFRLNELAHEEAQHRPKEDPPTGEPYAGRMKDILNQKHKLTTQLRLDVESLYIFANLALDQWSFVVAYCLGLSQPTSYTYRHLVDQLQGARTPTQLLPLKSQHLADAIWLQFQVRFYRNAFIEHVERPWQRGSTMGVRGEDFNFFICSPVGWIPEETEAEMIDSIRHLAPHWVGKLPKGHWQSKPRAVLEATYREIDQIPQAADREKVWKVWREIGGSTVSFEALCRRLISFLHESTKALHDSVNENPAEVDLGAAPSIDES